MTCDWKWSDVENLENQVNNGGRDALLECSYDGDRDGGVGDDSAWDDSGIAGTRGGSKGRPDWHERDGRLEPSSYVERELHHVRDRVLVFGGDGVYERYGDVWAFDPGASTWDELSPGGDQPPALAGAVVSFHAGGDELLVFGGIGHYQRSSDLWALDFSSASDGQWILATPDEMTPASGAGNSVVLEADALAFVFFGEGYYGYLETPQTSQL